MLDRSRMLMEPLATNTSIYSVAAKYLESSLRTSDVTRHGL